ncbi:potassium transporter TrkH [Geitlerinema sp. P-1104]|uniref:TrkH family potassium uptake protein n=1 Tax=Geitlerinema sp. P-1104 TaxID=2546230 RepID=UPI001476DAAD|nr:potassium transporter TrkH [Geitlerinema sp. P-1104]
MNKSRFSRVFTRLGYSHPLRLILLGYSLYIAVATLLLCLPFSWEDEPISFLDNLFIATSAVSTTGLITVNTPEAYNFFGELIILLAFQVGGLGYMTLGSFVLIASKNPISYVRQRVGNSVFSLPEGFEFRDFIRHTIIFTLIIEAIGVICLYILFRLQGLELSLWRAIFHSVSAFCTAGFSIFPNSLEDFRGQFGVNFVITGLSLFGAIGFLVVSDFWQTIRGHKRQITLSTRVILTFTGLLLILGFLFLLVFDSSLQDLGVWERILAAWFQAMTALTTVGFNTHPIDSLSLAGLFVILLLMIVGASPSGTGGGLKSTSVAAALATVWASLRGSNSITFFRRRLPLHRLLSAFSTVVFYLFAFCLGTTLLLLLQDQSFEDVIFEAASALGTVGLSRGITEDLTVGGKLVVIGLMFIGRVGVISFGVALFQRRSTPEIVSGEEDLVI